MVTQRNVLGLGLLAVTVAAQANLASSGFEYVGCVEADPKLFGLDISFYQPFKPQDCQAGCAGKANFAALGGGCHCDIPSQQPNVTFKVLPEDACTVLCIPGNPDAGRCGAAAEGDQPGFKLYNLYKRAGDALGGAAQLEVKEDCHKDGDTAMIKAAQASAAVVTHTIFSCPPEKTNCPLNANNKIPVSVSPCPPGGCQPASLVAPAPAPSTTPSAAPCPSGGCVGPIFNNKVPACPAGGCRSCTAGNCPPCTADNCLPVCPEGCVAPPPPETPVPTPSCLGGCNKPTTLSLATVPLSTASVSSPPSPPQPAPVPSSTRPAVASRGRQTRTSNVEMLAIMCAAMVLLAL